MILDAQYISSNKKVEFNTTAGATYGTVDSNNNGNQKKEFMRKLYQ